jgi:hypothetical protein
VTQGSDTGRTGRVHPSRWIRDVFPPETELGFGGSRDEHAVSVLILARNEERCIARCLDSVVRRGFDDIVVLDTGSTDKTTHIVAGYRDLGVRLITTAWPDSFAQARNLALDSVAAGWAVFLDADEWLTEQAATELGPCLASLSGIAELPRLVFAPRISEADHRASSDSVPRIFRSDSEIRYRGQVHEYPVVRGIRDFPVGLVGLDIEFRHDGYRPTIVEAKRKRERNLTLLDSARQSEPHEPRWLFFTIRDGLPVLGHDRILDLCTELYELADSTEDSADLLTAREYHRRALAVACPLMIAMGDRRALDRLCGHWDNQEPGSPDAHYFRTVRELLTGVVTDQDLLRTITVRGDGDLVATSAVDPTGNQLDALIIALLERRRGGAEAARYLELCTPWTDAFFENSVLRQAG